MLFHRSSRPAVTVINAIVPRKRNVDHLTVRIATPMAMVALNLPGLSCAAVAIPAPLVTLLTQCRAFFVHQCAPHVVDKAIDFLIREGAVGGTEGESIGQAALPFRNIGALVDVEQFN